MVFSGAAPRQAFIDTGTAYYGALTGLVGILLDFSAPIAQNFVDGDITANTINVTNTLANDARIQFTTTGTLPTGLALATDYYVINSTGSSYQVSLTEGGPAVTITADGTGTHTATEQAPDQNLDGLPRLINRWENANIDRVAIAAPTFSYVQANSRVESNLIALGFTAPTLAGTFTHRLVISGGVTTVGNTTGQIESVLLITPVGSPDNIPAGQTRTVNVIIRSAVAI